MSADGYEIVRYRPEFRDSVARLHAVEMRGGDPVRSARYLAWKYDENPYIAERLIYLALHRGEPVAMRGFFGTCWEAGDDKFVVPCAGDLVVAAAHQNRGLIAQLMQEAFRDLEARGHSHVFSLSAGDVAAMSARALGFKSVAKVEPLVRMRRFTITAILWRLKNTLRGLQGYEIIRRRPRDTRAELGPRNVPRVELKLFDQVAAGGMEKGLETSAEPRPEAMAGLVLQRGHKARIRHVRDAAYLRWRYASPAFDYRFVYSGGGQLDGFLALSATRGDAFPAIRIADWEGLNAEVKRRLLRAAISAGRFRQVVAWKLTASEEDLAVLSECGFVPEPRPVGIKGLGINVFVRPLGGAHPNELGAMPLFDRASWDYRMIYSDFA